MCRVHVLLLVAMVVGTSAFLYSPPNLFFPSFPQVSFKFNPKEAGVDYEGGGDPDTRTGHWQRGSSSLIHDPAQDPIIHLGSGLGRLGRDWVLRRSVEGRGLLRPPPTKVPKA